MFNKSFNLILTITALSLSNLSVNAKSVRKKFIDQELSGNASFIPCSSEDNLFTAKECENGSPEELIELVAVGDTVDKFFKQPSLKNMLNVYFFQHIFIFHEDQINSLNLGDTLSIVSKELNSENQSDLKNENEVVFRFGYFNFNKKTVLTKNRDLYASGIIYSRLREDASLGSLTVLANTNEELIFSYQINLDKVQIVKATNTCFDYKKKDPILRCSSVRIQAFQETSKASTLKKPIILSGEFTYTKN